MNSINTHKAGLMFGIFTGGLHFVWSLLVVTGLGQSLINFIFTLHMLKPVLVVADFNLGLAVTLVVMTSVIGYVVGFTLASLWNYVHR